jgi:hypothetical protein
MYKIESVFVQAKGWQGGKISSNVFVCVTECQRMYGKTVMVEDRN